MSSLVTLLIYLAALADFYFQPVGEGIYNRGTYTVQQAVKRIKEVSCPLNARRFQLHNPCAETGRCNPAECEKPICHVIASFERAPNGKRTQVILINESLGY